MCYRDSDYVALRRVSATPNYTASPLHCCNSIAGVWWSASVLVRTTFKFKIQDQHKYQYYSFCANTQYDCVRRSRGGCSYDFDARRVGCVSQAAAAAAAAAALSLHKGLGAERAFVAAARVSLNSKKSRRRGGEARRQQAGATAAAAAAAAAAATHGSCQESRLRLVPVILHGTAEYRGTRYEILRLQSVGYNTPHLVKPARSRRATRRAWKLTTGFTAVHMGKPTRNAFAYVSTQKVLLVLGASLKPYCACKVRGCSSVWGTHCI